MKKISRNTPHGIKETSEMLIFLIAFAEAVEASLEKGSNFFTKLTRFVPASMTAPDAFADAQLIIAEMGDLDEEEKASLYNTFARMDLENDHVEEIAESLLKEGLNIQQSIQNVIGIIKNARQQKEVA